jgi:hypothetical protein
MVFKRVFIGLGLLCALGPHAFPKTKTSDGDTSQITILVYNDAQVSQSALDQARQQAALIFYQAGIEIAWVDCSAQHISVCHQLLGPTQFVLRIVPNGQASSDTVFGLSFLGSNGNGKYSDVFYQRIEEISRNSGVNPTRLLGAVAAHEIGHLLLGSGAHSSFGVMSPRWSVEELRLIDMGSLGFNSEQSSRMKAHIGDWQRTGNLLALTTSKE